MPEPKRRFGIRIGISVIKINGVFIFITDLLM